MVALKALGRIQNILSVDDEELTLLTEITQIQSDILTEKLGGIPIPDSLIFIVIETTISRYRRLGAEGISNKRVDVIQNKYIEDLFEPYEDIISRHADRSNIGSKRIVRMI